jgi:hypothetical protein
MNQDKLHKFMDFMMKFRENMGIQILGKKKISAHLHQNINEIYFQKENIIKFNIFKKKQIENNIFFTKTNLNYK